MRRCDPERGAGRLSQLLEETQAIAHVGSWEWDIASGRLSWTDEHFRIFGLDPSVFTPTIENGLACVHEDDLARVRAALATTIEVGKPFSYVTRIRRPDGEIRWIESVGVPSVVDGVVVRLIGTVLDVTARELSNASLRESEARYKMIVETAREAIWVVDAEGITTFANEQLAVLLGRPLEELVGASGLRVPRRRGARRRRRELRRSAPGRRHALRLPVRPARRYGGLDAAQLRADPRRRRAVCTARSRCSPTSPSAAERRSDLHDSEARLAEAQRLALLGNWAFDVRSRVLTCSDELFLVLGVDPEQGIASFERFMLLVHPDDRVRATSFLTRVQTDFIGRLRRVADHHPGRRRALAGAACHARRRRGRAA